MRFSKEAEGPRRTMPMVLRLLALALLVPSAHAVCTWSNGDGSWTDAARWKNGIPDAENVADLRGHSRITVPPGSHDVGTLLVGLGSKDDVTLDIQGDMIVRQSHVQIAENGRGKAAVQLSAGALQCPGDVNVGAANSEPGRECEGTLRLAGGDFLCRIVTLGWGLGAKATLIVDGSKPSSIYVLDYVTLGAYHEGKPSHSQIVFNIDGQGVTPIIIGSKKEGLRLDAKGPAGNRKELQVTLQDVPPTEDITLIGAQKVVGVFDGKPEGTLVKASFGGREYSWILTYQGGDSHHDVVLTHVQGHQEGTPQRFCKPRPAMPSVRWVRPLPEFHLPEQLAFPGAEGFGAGTAGGRGGQTIAVTNLNDHGPGSLREAVNAPGPRVVEFRVGGTIQLQSKLAIREPFLTLDGEKSPEPGITLHGATVQLFTHDVILRHLRIRPGRMPGDEDDALSVENATRCVLDHLSCAWGSDEVLSVTGVSDLITVQWCIIAESLNDKKHGYASILGGNRVTWHHNLLTANESRNPRFANTVNCDFRNNVLANWGHTCGYGEWERLNYVGNFAQPGPATRQSPRYFIAGTSTQLPGSLFVEGNVLEAPSSTEMDEWKGFDFNPEIRAKVPFSAPPVQTDDARQARERVLANAGALPTRRDATDQRLIEDVRKHQGNLVDAEPAQ